MKLFIILLFPLSCFSQRFEEKIDTGNSVLTFAHKRIKAQETRDTSKATILIDTDLPCGNGCFLTGSVKSYRVTIHVPYQKLESDFFVEKHEQIYYYDQNWKRIKKYYPTPLKEGW